MLKEHSDWPVKLWISFVVIHLDFHSAKQGLWLVAFLVTCPWSNSNISRLENNWAVVVCTPHVISAWINKKWRDFQHVLMSAWLLNFTCSKEARRLWTLTQRHFLEQMLPLIFIIPNEFLFVTEIIKALYYYNSYYFSCTSKHL